MKRIFNLFIFAMFFILTAKSAYSQNTNNAAISNVSILKNPQSISLTFNVKGAFTKEIEDAIKSGIPTPFTFIVELYKERTLWFNERVAELKFKHIVQYDTLKAEYELTIEEKDQQDRIIKLKDFSQVKEFMAKVEGISVSISETPQKGSKYILKIKAKLDTVNLFFPLNYMLFFVSFWDFETDWSEETILY
ncbi:MAG: DUF4390 domain-containing protein [Deltaproteobacteria bacterium]|nr:DUF4390 domain-containing protein [Deltaproteobacteria bacterium]